MTSRERETADQPAAYAATCFVEPLTWSDGNGAACPPSGWTGHDPGEPFRGAPPGWTRRRVSGLRPVSRLVLVRRPFHPNAVLVRLGHQEQGEQEHHRGKSNRVGERPGEASGRGIRSGRDDGHETSAPAIAD